MAEKIQEKINRLRQELNKIPRNKRYALGGKGVVITSKIHKLEVEKERKKKLPGDFHNAKNNLL